VKAHALRFLWALALLAFPGTAFAAIAFDNTGDFNCANGTTCDVTYVVNSNTNGFLHVEILATPTVNSITYDGASLTKQSSNALPFVGANLDDWYLYAPSSGSHTLHITLASADTPQGTITSYTGAAQSGYPDSSTSATSNSNTTDCTVTINSVATGAWGIIDAAMNRTTTGGGTNTTRRTTQATIAQYGDSNGSITTGTTLTMVQTPSNFDWCIGYSIAPAATAAVTASSILGMVRSWWIF
jgi:hypothetical protein